MDRRQRGYASQLGLLLGLSLLSTGVFVSSAQTKPKGKTPDPFAKEIAPVLAKYCLSCHSGKSPAGGIDLSRFKSGTAAAQSADLWNRVHSNVSSGHMPPAGMPKVPAELKKRMTAAIESILSGDCDLADVGRVTIRRLNRAEYNNTIRDLAGVEFSPADDFPSDDVGYGFDNIGDVLSISPLLMEKYLSAAEQVAAKAIVVPGTETVRFEGDALVPTGGARHGDIGVLMYSVGAATATFKPAKPGNYKIKVRAWGQQAGPEPCKMSVATDGLPLATVEVLATQSKPGEYEFPIVVRGREPQKISVAFINDYYKPEDPNPANRDRNMAVDSIEVVGPFNSKLLSESHKKIIYLPPSEDRTKDARTMLGTFATKAYRRPVSAEELDRLMTIFALTQKTGESFERGMQVCVAAVLSSPHFLFRVELDGSNTGVRALNDYELASRLSYFLWSSMPDDTLFALAAKGTLKQPEVLTQQVTRMLASPKAKALSDNFAEQWLQLRRLDNFNPDPQQFASFDKPLKEAMVTETKLFFQSVVSADRSLVEFIDGKFTFLNERLAKHYGIAGVSGEEFRKVALTGEERGGVITQGAVLSVTSNPTRTSPTKRGKWILEQILGTPPPPPPPGVDNLGETAIVRDAKTLRALMEQHRSKPDCASCHSRMDPLGFSLENYDAVGAWRTTEDGQPVDASGVLPDGKTFRGAPELKKILLSRKDEFARSFTEKLMTYALGRGLDANDNCNLDAVTQSVKKDGYRFSAVVKSIVLSEPFRKRRGG